MKVLFFEHNNPIYKSEDIKPLIQQLTNSYYSLTAKLPNEGDLYYPTVTIYGDVYLAAAELERVAAKIKRLVKKKNNSKVS